jgi:DNA-binding NtrC family response regulator
MGPKLLIVEADGVFRQNLALRLQHEKFEVFEADDSEGLHRLLKRRDVDVVLLGLNGFKERGLSLLKIIKAIRPLTEIILMNSPRDLPLSIAGMKLGAFDDLLLPFDLEALLDRVRKAWARKRELEAKRKGRSILNRCQDAMVAVSFAEAGQPDMAREVLRNSRGDYTEGKG